MHLKCIAIDDEPLALALIREYAQRIPSLQLVQTFDDALSGAEYMAHHAVDLLFVDINMPDITGVELVRALKNKPMVIFTTAYKNFAFEGFQLQAIDYLLKPIDFKRFSFAVEKALDYHRYKNGPKQESFDEHIYVYSEYRMIPVRLAEIEYIESMEDYIKIHLSGVERPVLTLMTLKKVAEKLPASHFQRIHRSFIVAIQKIRSIHNRKVQLSVVELPVGESYSDFINQWKTGNTV